MSIGWNTTKQPKYRVIALPMSDAATFFRAEVSLLDLYFCLLNFKLFKTFQNSLLEIGVVRGVVVLMYRGNSISERYLRWPRRLNENN